MGNNAPTDKQWMKLLDIVTEDTEMRTGQFLGPNGKVRITRKWENAATTLNEIVGAKKSGAEWKELKSRAKTPYQDRKAYMAGTGGGVTPKLADLGLSVVYQKCIQCVGTIAATGSISVANPLEIQRSRGLENTCSLSSAGSQPTDLPRHHGGGGVIPSQRCSSSLDVPSGTSHGPSYQTTSGSQNATSTSNGRGYVSPSNRYGYMSPTNRYGYLSPSNRQPV